MCRIAGIVSRDKKLVCEGIEVMRDVMHRGGPDDKGLWVDEEAGVALGHRRLSLIDLSAQGHQPMSDVSGRYKIIYNGEIYNFADIRAELESCGSVFRSHTDTEVVIEAYKRWGTDAFHRFNGMFAFALYDRVQRQLILVRDAVGIKPLYYGQDDEGFYFASEVRGIRSIRPQWRESEDWRVMFLAFGFIPEPFTILREVQMLPPGHMLSLDVSTGQQKVSAYFSFSYQSEITDKSIALSAVETSCSEAVKRHLISDAPIGVFLSGGIDSSILTALASQHSKDAVFTLSVSFPEAEYSEHTFQKLVADRYHTNHHNFEITNREFFDELPDILQAYDQPSIDAINTYFISKYARKAGLKAVLSGVGADELLGGYPSFARAAMANRLMRLPSWVLSTLAGMAGSDNKKRIGYLKSASDQYQYLFHRGIFTAEQIAGYLGMPLAQVHEVLARIMHLPASLPGAKEQNALREFHYYMRNQLLRDADVMGMWHGIEIRVPFLDSVFVQTAWNIDPAVKFGHSRPKHLLIESFRHLLPEPVYNRKKQGFTFPFQKWLNRMETESGYLPPDDPVRRKFLDNKIHWSKYWVYLNATSGITGQAPAERRLPLHSSR